MTDMTVATEIRNQIGQKSLYMMGAKNLGGGENYLSFQIRGSKVANHITVTLNSMDTCDVTYKKIRGHNCKTVSTSEGLYADMLHNDFEAVAGYRMIDGKRITLIRCKTFDNAVKQINDFNN